jgi:hypothetical protein
VNNKVAYQLGYKYKLVEDYGCAISLRPPQPIDTRLIALSADGGLLIRAGYAWDGATGMPDSPDIIRGSLVHDACYQLMREGVLNPARDRAAIDWQLYQHCLQDGMQPMLARLVHDAVSKFGAVRLKADPKWTHYAPPDPAEPLVFKDKEGAA